jgi:predicted dehydrogenase
MEELNEIKDAYKSQVAGRRSQILMVGFNRRFAPHVVKIKELLKGVKEPKSFIMTVNAGMIPSNHWTQDMNIGGGRIIGEACHFIDLLRFLADNPITDSRISKLTNKTQDTVTIQLCFEDGSIGTVHYFANGNKSFPKERLEVFCGGRILHLDNFRVLKGYGWKNFNKMKLWRQDKGHVAGVKAFVQAVQGREQSPISFEEIVELMEITIKVSANGV